MRSPAAGEQDPARPPRHEVGALLSTHDAEAFVEGVFEQVHVVERIPWPQHGSTPESHSLALWQARTVGYDVALVASEEPEAYGFAREAGSQALVELIGPPQPR